MRRCGNPCNLAPPGRRASPAAGNLVLSAASDYSECKQSAIVSRAKRATGTTNERSARRNAARTSDCVALPNIQQRTSVSRHALRNSHCRHAPSQGRCGRQSQGAFDCGFNRRRLGHADRRLAPATARHAEQDCLPLPRRRRERKRAAYLRRTIPPRCRRGGGLATAGDFRAARAAGVRLGPRLRDGALGMPAGRRYCGAGGSARLRGEGGLAHPPSTIMGTSHTSRTVLIARDPATRRPAGLSSRPHSSRSGKAHG